MDTVLFTLGPFHIYAYGAMLSLGYGAAVVLALRETRRRGWSSDMMLDYLICVFIAGLLMARILFVLCELPYFTAFPEELLSINNGLSGLGAILGFVAVTAWVLRQTHWDYRHLADVLAAPLALATAITSVGTSRVGRVTALALAVVSDGQGFHPLGAYQAIGSYLTFVVVWNLRRKAKFPGQLGLLSIFGLGLTQFLVGFFAEPHFIYNGGQLLGVLAMASVIVIVRNTDITEGEEDYMEHHKALGPSKAPWYRRIGWVWGLLFLLCIYYLRAFNS